MKKRSIPSPPARNTRASARISNQDIRVNRFQIFKYSGTIVILAMAVFFFSLKATIKPNPVTAATSVFINEIHYDNTGTDAGEAIEIAGPAGTDLTGWSLVLYNGSGGAPYNTTNLSGVIPDQQDGFGTLSFSYPVNGIQNGSPDGIALVSGSTVVQFLSYEGSFAAVGGPANGMTSTDIGVSEAGTEPLGQSLSLTGSGQDYEDFTWTAPAASTFGAVNTGQTFAADEECTAVFVNELHYDNAGTDTGEAIEIAGPAGTDLTGWSIVLYNGANGASYNTRALSGIIPNQQNGFGTLNFTYPTDGIQNGSPDGIALVNGSTVVQFLSYEGTFTAIGGPADGLTSTDIGVTEVGTTTVGHSLSLTGAGCCYADFTWTAPAANTFGAVNTGQTFSCDDEVFLSINDVTANEGDGGATIFSFTVSLNQPAPASGVTFNISTADDSATVADNDYVTLNLIGEVIASGDQSKTYQVTVNGDMVVEPNERFFVNVTNVVGANVLDGQGIGTILNDDVVITPIHVIQGSGTSSPLVGQQVTTEGIVTGRRFNNGFFIQTSDGAADLDPNTSQGIFVFTSSAPPAAAAVGNLVRVTGTVVEFRGDPNSPPLTEIGNSPTVSVVSPGNTLPAPITLTAADTSPSGAIEQLERFEAMRVHVASLTVIAPTQGSVSEPNATGTSNGVFFGVITGIARPFREPGIEVPNPVPMPPTPNNVPRFDANPERLRVDSDGLIGATRLEATTGATIANLVGPLDYAFRTYSILPDPGTLTQASVIGNISATPVPLPCPGEFTVASFNMQRFFDTVNDPAIGDPVLSDTAFNNRLNKVSLAIRNVLRSPDIIGVQEIENLSTLQAIATKVNTDAVAAGGPNPGYLAFLEEGNDIGGIDVGFLVKGSRVNVISVTQEGKTATFINPDDGQPDILNDRPPLVLRAAVQPPAGPAFPVTVIVNHLRSLIDIEDPAAGNRVRHKRRAQAEFLANLIDARQTADPSERIISVGDYNAFQFNDGLVDVIGTIKGTSAPPDQVVLATTDDLVEPDLTDLVDLASPDQRYSFLFDGNAQVLDHIIVTGNLLPRLSRFHYGRSNADFPESFRSDPTRPERITDHDQPVAYFQLPLAITNISVDKPVLWPPNHQMVDVTVSYTVSNNCAPPVCTLSVTSNEPVDGEDDGNTAPDWEVIDDHHVRLRAERSGTGTGRIYTITITCTDQLGNSTSETVTVTVPINNPN